jgi:hypothetical protein
VGADTPYQPTGLAGFLHASYRNYFRITIPVISIHCVMSFMTKNMTLTFFVTPLIGFSACGRDQFLGTQSLISWSERC